MFWVLQDRQIWQSNIPKDMMEVSWQWFELQNDLRAIIMNWMILPWLNLSVIGDYVGPNNRPLSTMTRRQFIVDFTATSYSKFLQARSWLNHQMPVSGKEKVAIGSVLDQLESLGPWFEWRDLLKGGVYVTHHKILSTTSSDLGEEFLTCVWHHTWSSCEQEAVCQTSKSGSWLMNIFKQHSIDLHETHHSLDWFKCMILRWERIRGYYWTQAENNQMKMHDKDTCRNNNLKGCTSQSFTSRFILFTKCL